MSAENGVHTDTQFSIFLINRPGVLSRVVQKLAKDKINIVALSMMDSTEHGVLRLVVEDPAKARACLAELDLPKQETTILAATRGTGRRRGAPGRRTHQHPLRVLHYRPVRRKDDRRVQGG